MLTRKEMISTSDSMRTCGARNYGIMLTQKGIVSTSDSMRTCGARNYDRILVRDSGLAGSGKAERIWRIYLKI